MKSAIVCVAVPHFPLVVAIEGTQVPADSPILIADGVERARVIDLSPHAYGLGARVGMTALQAQAVVREATTLVTDPVLRRRRWEAILDALDAVTPIIEDGGEGYASCEMRGIEGDPQRWMRAIRDVLAPFAVPARLGAGSNRFIARVAAHRERACPSGKEAAFVAGMPIEILDIAPDTLARLHLLGIRKLGELAALPHGPFVRRFGPQAARWHALACGIDGDPLVPRPHHARIERGVYGEGRATSEEALLFALRGLVARVAADLVHLGKRAAELILTLECEDGTVHSVSIRIAHPTAREPMLFDLVRTHLDGLRLLSAVEGLRLGVHRTEDGGVPLALFCGDDPNPEAVELAVARLVAAFGDDAALHARVVEGHRPESQSVYDPFTPEMLESKGWRGGAASGPSEPPHKAAMQLRTFAPREIAVIVREGAPKFVGSPPQSVLDCAGPWRVDEEWWAPAALARDDYDIMLEDGAVYRIARRGARWFTIGVYD